MTPFWLSSVPAPRPFCWNWRGWCSGENSTFKDGFPVLRRVDVHGSGWMRSKMVGCQELCAADPRSRPGRCAGATLHAETASSAEFVRVLYWAFRAASSLRGPQIAFDDLTRLLRSGERSSSRWRQSLQLRVGPRVSIVLYRRIFDQA